MDAHRPQAPLTALLIAPDRELAGRFTATLGRSRAFQVLADIKTYPPPQVLDMRLRQVRPQVVLLDVATDIGRASEVIGMVVERGVPLACIHHTNDSEAILRTLRLGAAEFLYEPFEPGVQEQARARIARMLGPAPEPAREPGQVLAFTSAKPGAGASTLATQVALSLRRQTEARVLIADLDLMDATVSFYLRLRPERPLLDALAGGGAIDDWPELVEHTQGLDTLGAPEYPAGENAEPPRMAEFIERARQLYDWTIIDLPPVFHRVTLLAASHSDTTFVVCSPELPSLHLARKATGLFAQLGFGPERYKVLLNRVEDRWSFGAGEVARIVNSRVNGSFPNDYFALEHAISAGAPLEGSTALGRAIEEFVRTLAPAPAAAKR